MWRVQAAGVRHEMASELASECKSYRFAPKVMKHLNLNIDTMEGRSRVGMRH